MVVTLSPMIPQTASRYLWSWSLSRLFPFLFLFFAEYIQHSGILLPFATAFALGWVNFSPAWSLFMRLVAFTAKIETKNELPT